MTPDQVEAAMGKPEKKVTLGTKQIYYYKDMKVIFLSGKVSRRAVEPSRASARAIGEQG